MATNYAYFYAIIGDLSNGECTGLDDTSDYILDRAHIPVPDYNFDYLLKYYWPIPETVTSFDDFQGSWYEDAAHTMPWNLA